jgi:predicted Zn-dependent protease
LLAVLAVVASLRTAQRNLDWRTEHDLFSLAVRQAPTSPLLWAHLAVAEIVQGDMSAAKEALRKAQLVGPREYHVLASQVLYLTVDKKYEQALEVQEKIAESLEHGKAVALNNLAYLYRVTGRLDKALEILEGLLSESQAYSDVHFNLGEIYRLQGRDDRAREAYRLALEDQPEDLRFGHALLTLEFESQRYEEAERIVRDLLRKHPDELALLVNLAMIRHRQGDVEGATEILRGVVLENPEFVPARLALGSVLKEAGRLEEAIGHLEVAARLGKAGAEGSKAREALSEIGAPIPSQSTTP